LLDPESAAHFTCLLKRAMFEMKAGKAAQADEYERQALATLVEPTPLWLVLLIESIRYRMTKATQNGYLKLWVADLKKKTRSETAGEMAALLRGFLDAGIEYTGRASHVKRVAAYLDRTKTLKYRLEDIEHVVEFLNQVDDKNTLREKLVAQGLKLHPNSVLLNYHHGLIALGYGPHSQKADRGRESLEKAIAQAEASNDPKATALLPAIKHMLTAFNEMLRRTPAFGPMGPSIFDSDDEFDEDDWYDDDLDDDDDYDDEDDWGSGPGFSQAPAPSAPRKKKKSRKKR
jgi:hypothetical protein